MSTLTGRVGQLVGGLAQDAVSVARGAARLPLDVARTADILLTTDRAVIGATPRDVVWTHRKTTLYRYRSADRRHAVPVLLVFALINRPEIFDLRPGSSFVEFLLGEGFDVFLVDWGVPGEEDADMGVADYVCDELHWAVRETVRASGSPEVSVVGWCIGAALSAMYTALHPDGAVRNLVLLTMPLDTSGSLYRQWVGRPSFDADRVATAHEGVPGPMVDTANKLMKPVTNYLTTKRRLFGQVRQGTANKVAYQAMAKWVADNPRFPQAAFRDWIRLMYKENRLVDGTLTLRGRQVDLGAIRRQAVLVVTAAGDHIAPRAGTLPVLSMVSTTDLTHFDRPGGHIGLMAGSKAKGLIWPDIAGWLVERSRPARTPRAVRTARTRTARTPAQTPDRRTP
ncbi:alpha/beta fold hydrolase [Kineosporia sp. R_H_3]|uniref:alpha/beta fold hydrolase n=1 Tax=Kineosporia sp. R_H_3 TaxID=1961848 RepID=UPI0018E96729|nr:alpha/beta fold hydrolase [Kineosporia sp. R_H_3]